MLWKNSSYENIELWNERIPEKISEFRNFFVNFVSKRKISSWNFLMKLWNYFSYQIMYTIKTRNNMHKLSISIVFWYHAWSQMSNQTVWLSVDSISFKSFKSEISIFWKNWNFGKLFDYFDLGEHGFWIKSVNRTFFLNKMGFKKTKNTPKMTKNESKMDINCFQCHRFLDKSTKGIWNCVKFLWLGF